MAEKTFSINGNAYTIITYPARLSTRRLVQCAPLIGLFQSVIASESIAPLAAVDSEKTADQLDQIMAEFAKQCTVIAKGSTSAVALADVFDVWFSEERYLEMWQWLYSCIEANWKSFFDGLGAMIIQKLETMAKANPSKTSGQTLRQKLSSSLQTEIPGSSPG